MKLLFRFEIDDIDAGVFEADKAKEMLEEALRRHPSEIAIIRPERKTQPKWERMLYGILGVKQDNFHSRLLAAFNQSLAHLTYEKNDVTWEARSEEASQKGDCEFFTPRGEKYNVESSLCLDFDKVHKALIEFTVSGERPKLLNWTRSS